MSEQHFQQSNQQMISQLDFTPSLLSEDSLPIMDHDIEEGPSENIAEIQTQSTDESIKCTDKKTFFLKTFMFSLISILVVVQLITVIFWRIKVEPGTDYKDPSVALKFHIIFSLVGSTILYPIGAIIFRMMKSVNRKIVKGIHSAIMLGVVICILGGFSTMYEMKKVNNSPHFYTAHAILGGIVILLLISQFLVGFVSFSLQVFCENKRALIRIVHVTFGKIFLYCYGMLIFYGMGRTYSRVKPPLDMDGILSLFVSFNSLMIIILTTFVINSDFYRK